MLRRTLLGFVCAVGLSAAFAGGARAEDAYGRQWSGTYNTQDWDRFYHYPYVYYPQNFYGGDYYRSSESLYYRYPQEMRIPVYNTNWQNEYPQARRYYSGAHFILDTF